MITSNFRETSGESRAAANFGILLLSFSFLIGAATYAFKIYIQGGGAFQTADWLINYHGGFVRRGLFGSIFLGLFGHAPSLIWFLYLIQFLLYGVVFGFFIFNLVKSKSNWLLTILICSPAGIAFSGWDLYAFGRKEVIGYVVLILLSARISKRENLPLSRGLLILTFVTYLVGIFSWEPLVLLLPSIILLVSKGFQQDSSRMRIYFTNSIFIVSGFICIYLSIKFKGTVSQVSLICASIRDAGLDGKELCSGAVESIGWSTSFTIERVRSSYPLYFWYFPLFIIALFPILYYRVLSASKNISVLSFLFLLPLYFVVNDYGRWFSMYFISLLIVLIAENGLNLKVTNCLTSPKFGISYLISWGLPHCADPSLAFPIVGFIATPLKILDYLL